MIQLKDISLSYGSAEILKDVNLTIRENGLTSIIGPNGAGKSSLLSILNRMQKPSNGQVQLEGINLQNYRKTDLAKRVSVLKQDNQINARINVQDLVCFGRFPHHRGRPTQEDWKIIQQAIDYLDLDDLKNRYLDQLSGGQRQRAFIAMVLAQDTQYIFLDEPLNNLDMKHSVAIMKQLRTACDELNKSIVVVLHDINFASCYSDEIIAMKNGEVIYVEPPKVLMQNSYLENLYEMPLQVREINEKALCLYYL